MLRVLFFTFLHSISGAMLDRRIVVDFEDNEKGVWLTEGTFMRDLISRDITCLMDIGPLYSYEIYL